MVTLPHGYCLGRVEPSEAQAILAAEGLHDLGRVRGRSLWPKPVQSADVAFRETLGPRGLEPTGVRLIEARESDGEWIVRLEAVTMGAPPSTHELRVTQTMSTTTFPKSCGDEPVLVPLLRARRPQ